jgi:predicted enzyme related to lactoylglutathione lyase
MTEVTRHAPGTPSWVDLATTDAEAAKAFYTALFGWEGDNQGQGSGYYTMLRKDGRDVAALFPAGPEGGPPHWNTYVTVADVDRAVERTEPAGGSVVVPPFDVMDLGRMAIISDPTGAVIALWESRGHIGARLVNEPGAFCWSELTTSDRERAAAFYGAVLGWSSRTNTMGPMTYTEFQNGVSTVAGMTEMAGVPPNWGVYFAVEDADETVARTEELGGTVVRPVMDLPIGRFATLLDPQRAVFSIIQFTRPPDDAA